MTITSLNLVSAHGWLNDWDNDWMMMGWNYSNGNMDLWGYSHMWSYWYIWGLIHLLIFVLVVYLIYLLINTFYNKSKSDSSIEILRERFAKWEINKKEFEEHKKILNK